MRNGKNCKIVMSLMLVIVMTILTGCDTFDSFRNTFINKVESDSNVIRIGVFEPQTGKYADNGLAETKGIELAHSIYNSVNGYKVELVKVDTQSSASAAKTAIKGLIKMKPVAIIGSCGEATSLIAAKYIDKAEIPTITPSATNPLITQTSEYYFRASVTNVQMGTGVADYVYRELGSKKIAVVTAKNDTVATALMDGFNDKIKEYLKAEEDEEEDGDEDRDSDEKKKEKESPVVLTEETDMSDESVNSILNKIKKKNADTVFITLGTEAMDTFFTAVEKKKMTDIRFVGTRNWGDPAFVEMMKEHQDINIAFPYDSVMGNTGIENLSEEAQRFQIEYANMYGSNDIPSDGAARGYDSYLLLMNAIHKAGTNEGSAIRKALIELKDVKCSTGLFNFDSNGNTVRNVNICTIEDGKVVSMHITKEKTEAKDLEGVK